MIASQEKIIKLLDNYYIENDKKLYEKFFQKLNKENINYDTYLLKKNSLIYQLTMQIFLIEEKFIKKFIYSSNTNIS